MTYPPRPSEVPPALRKPLGMANIPALDGIRAVAVSIVLLFHFVYVGFPGHLGVVMFFVLSGFLITWLLLKEDAQTDSISIKGFYRRRMLRIFPAFYCYWLVHVGFLVVTGDVVPWRSAVAAFFYYSNYFLGHAENPYPRIMVHTWSLSIEEQFYLLWPWVFVWQRRRPRRLLAILAAAICVVQLWRPAALLVLGMEERRVEFSFESRCDALLVGCALGIAIWHGWSQWLWRWLTSSVLLPIVPLAGLVGLSWAIIRWPAFQVSVAYTLGAYLIAVFMVQMIAFHDRAPWSWLNSGVMRFGGRISYPLYLYHVLTMPLGDRMFPEIAWRYQLAGSFAFTLLCATASYVFVEKPFLRLQRRPQPVAAVALIGR